MSTGTNIEQALRPLTAYETGGWGFQDDGYYIHRNRVYLQGFAYNPQDTPVTGALFTGIPTIMRPSSTQTCPVVLIAEDPATVGIDLPTSTTATITPGGDISIPVPPYANARPGAPYTDLGSDEGYSLAVDTTGPGGEALPRSMWALPFGYTVILGNVSWLIGPALGGAYTKESLGPYLTGDFDNIDGEIGLHGARVHLSGHIRANTNGARVISGAIPSEYVTAVDNDGGDYTTAGGPRFEVAIQVLAAGGLAGHGHLFVANQDARPPMNPPATWQPLIEVAASHFNDPFGGDLGTADSGLAGLTTHPGRKQNPSGFSIPSSGWTGVQPGGERIQSQFTEGYVAGPPSSSLSDVIGAPGIFLDISSQLAAFWPPPDWVAIELGWQTHVPGWSGAGDPSTYIAPTALTVTSDVSGTLVWGWRLGSQYPITATPGDVIGALPVTASMVPVSGTGSGVPDGTGAGNGTAWLVPASYPGSSGYDIDPNNLAKGMLWRPEAAPMAFTLTIDDGQNYTVAGSLAADVIPFWYTRRHWVMKDDVIDLTGAGWQNPYTAPELPPVPTTVTPGPSDTGVTPSGKTTGADGGAVSTSTPAGSGWVTVGATYYNDPPPGAGDLSAPGFHFAELGTARRTDGGATGVGNAAAALGMSGELPMGFQLDIEYNGRVITADKQDRGYGQGGDGVTSDPYYAIDLYDGSASGLTNAPAALAFPGEGAIRIRPH